MSDYSPSHAHIDSFSPAMLYVMVFLFLCWSVF